MSLPPPRSTRFPYTTLFRSTRQAGRSEVERPAAQELAAAGAGEEAVVLDDQLAAGEDVAGGADDGLALVGGVVGAHRSEEHTSELQSRGHLVCRLLLEKKKK